MHGILYNLYKRNCACIYRLITCISGGSEGLCLEEEQLAKPIKRFLADFVRKQVIGIPTQTLGYILCLYINSMGIKVTAEIELKDIGAESKVALEDLCKKAVDHSLRNGNFQPVHLTQVSNLITAHDTAWRKQDLAQ